MKPLRYGHAVVAHFLVRPALEALEVRYYAHVFEQVAGRAVVFRFLDQMIDDHRGGDAQPLRRLVVEHGGTDHPDRGVVLDADAAIRALHLNLHVARQHEVVQRVAGAEQADAAVQIFLLRHGIQDVVGEAEIHGPAFGAGDIVLRAAGMLLAACRIPNWRDTTGRAAARRASDRLPPRGTRRACGSCGYTYIVTPG